MKTRFKKGDSIKCVQRDFPTQREPRVNFMEVATVENTEDGIFYGDGFGNYCEECDAYPANEDCNTLNEEEDE